MKERPLRLSDDASSALYDWAREQAHAALERACAAIMAAGREGALANGNVSQADYAAVRAAIDQQREWEELAQALTAGRPVIGIERF